MRNIIIDCDPGIDDAIALLFALSRFDWCVQAITAVAGNVAVQKTAANAVKICTLANQQVPVYAGAAKPLERAPRRAEHVHGKDGLGGVQLTAGYSVEKEHAVHYLIRQAAQNPIEIITQGPLTNIAHAIQQDSRFSSRVKHLTIMGGALAGGNATKYAEFNIYADPEAANIVFRSGIPILMIGLDVTEQAVLPVHVIQSWMQSSQPLVQAAGNILHGYLRIFAGFDTEGIAMHDPLAVAAAWRSSLVTTTVGLITVDTHGKFTGRTTMQHSPTGTIQAAQTLNQEAFLQYLIQGIEQLGQSTS